MCICFNYNIRVLFSLPCGFSRGLFGVSFAHCRILPPIDPRSLGLTTTYFEKRVIPDIMNDPVGIQGRYFEI